MPDLLVKNSKIHGTGCYAGKDFRKGEIVGEYTGEWITNEEADDRYEDVEETYLFVIDDDTCIDAMNDPNPVKYINHCCEPNCESDQKGNRIFIIAIKDIKKGDELTYDYNLETDPEDDDPLTCNCKAGTCRGTMKAEE